MTLTIRIRNVFNGKEKDVRIVKCQQKRLMDAIILNVFVEHIGATRVNLMQLYGIKLEAKFMIICKNVIEISTTREVDLNSEEVDPFRFQINLMYL